MPTSAATSDNTPEKSPAELLATPVQFVKGVGSQRAELFARLGIHIARDLLYFFPRDYQDMSNMRDIAELDEGAQVSIRGEIVEVDFRTTASGSTMFGILVEQGSHFLRAIWFNQSYMREKLQRGQHVMLFGRVKLRGMRWEMAQPLFEVLASEESLPSTPLQPVYPLTEGLSQYQVRNATRNALEAYVELLDEVFPQSLLDRYGLAGLHDTLKAIHYPESQAELDNARRRLVFQELFVLQLALMLRRQKIHAERSAPALPATAKIDARIRRLLPFKLTADQDRVLAEVIADMATERPMNRLLQGEVGSGKTIVAVYAMMTCVAHGWQSAIMAPTEILARQHFQTLSRTLAGSQVRIGLLTGSLTAKERTELLTKLKAGEIDLLVGTQAIVQAGLEFAKLGLVVIDEQHKFGVRQRAALKQAGPAPHYLVMTATPIPRTVSMTLFGDLDISTLRESPPGRQPVNTYLVENERVPQWWEFVRKKLNEGRQAYVITPLVDESEHWEADSVASAHEDLANGPLEAFRIDVVHGRMNAIEKDEAMQRFHSGETQVLISTSVVEVGVDVPNATVMTIQGAERFGLAQLHQLRGRIRRGKFPGFCGVQADPQTDDARQRLEAFVATTNGFELAELDFQLRGPGDLLGTRQHGLPPLRMADLTRDAATLEEARHEAEQLIEEDPGLNSEQHALLKRMVLVRYGQALELGDVG